MNIEQQIINLAHENGADIAGIADVAALRSSPAHTIYTKMGDYSGVGTTKDGETLTFDELYNWPEEAKSALVIGLSHPKEKPELDWWDGKGGTPGNRKLMEMIKQISSNIEENIGVKTKRLHYYVEKGGIFLKDAAVLAGLGCMGKSNLFVSPEYGPRIRLRALFLNAELVPTGPVDFDPCRDCDMYCRKACPEHAIDKQVPLFANSIFSSMWNPPVLPARDGTYSRESCNDRMEKDIAVSEQKGGDKQEPVKYCRECEFVCPVGK